MLLPAHHQLAKRTPVPNKAESILLISTTLGRTLKAECKASCMPSRQCQTDNLRGRRLTGFKNPELSNNPRTKRTKCINLQSSAFSLSLQSSSISSAVIDTMSTRQRQQVWHFSTSSLVPKSVKLKSAKCRDRTRVSIGNKCKMQNNVSVYKGITLEDGVFCGPSMVFTNIYNPAPKYPRWIRYAQLSSSAALRLARIAPSFAAILSPLPFIGAGTVVTKDVPDHASWSPSSKKKAGCAYAAKNWMQN